VLLAWTFWIALERITRDADKHSVSLAYVITVHQSHQQLMRLLRAIDAPLNTYVLHVDVKSDPAMHAAVSEFTARHENASFIRPENTMWGSWRLARAQIRGMKEALRVSNDWDYCLNLTGRDYPLKTQQEIISALSAGPAGANYLEVLDFAHAGANPRKRLDYYWIPWRGKMKKLIRRRAPGFKVYWGSNYFALTRAACEYLVSSDVSRRMQRYFRFSLCADELIFQNALMHGPAGIRDSIVSKTFRKITWEGGSHPRTYTMNDLDDLLASDAFFARKFDEAVDPKVLDALDERLHRHSKAAVA
jgi:hypothetical protein